MQVVYLYIDPCGMPYDYAIRIQVFCCGVSYSMSTARVT